MSSASDALPVYTTEDIFRLGRSILSVLVPNKNIRKWAEAFQLASTRSLTHLSRLSGISRQTMNRLHSHIFVKEPDLVAQYPHLFPAAVCRGPLVKSSSGEQVPVSVPLKKGPAPSSPDPVDNLKAPKPLAPPELKLTASGNRLAPDHRTRKEAPQFRQHYRDLLDKRNFEDMLARNLAETDDDHDYNNMVKIAEKLAKVKGWDQEVRIEYQVQAILPPGGAPELPNEVNRVLGQLKELGIVDAEFEVLPPDTGRPESKAPASLQAPEETKPRQICSSAEDLSQPQEAQPSENPAIATDAQSVPSGEKKAKRKRGRPRKSPGPVTRAEVT